MPPANWLSELTRLVDSAYNRADLERFVRERLSIDLYNYAPQNEHDLNTINALVVGLHRIGRLVEFVRAFRDGEPAANRADVRRYCDAFLADPPPSVAPGPGPTLAQIPTAARDMVVRFNDRFQRCRSEFQYLNGYKELHDVLHKLQAMLDAIETASGRFRTAPTVRRELLGIVVGLRELVASARAGAGRLFDPDDVADWLGAFEAAVADLDAAVRAADVPRLDLATEVLAGLPAKQAEVNEELVKAAKRLGVEGLIGLVDEILAELSPAGVGPAAGFRAGLERFRESCGRLTGLRQDHNSCQHVESALAVTATLPDATAARVPGWADVRRRVQELAARRPTDALAAGVAASAVRFEAAAPGDPAADEFVTLLIGFRGLFNRTDDALLTVTDDLVREAELLDVQLRTLTDVQPA